jgi:molybdate transport system regulatory protein
MTERKQGPAGRSANAGPARKRPTRRPAAALARFRLRVTAGDLILVGPGKIALLEAIRDTRSITAAAKSMGMSYRRAWILVDEMNGALASAAVASATGGERGGGSTLTALGHELVDVYRRIEATAARACAADIARLLELAAARRAASAPQASGARRRSRSTP